MRLSGYARSAQLRGAWYSSSGKTWAGRHDLGVGDVLGVEVAQLLVRAQLFAGEIGRRRVPLLEPLHEIRRSGAGHVGVDTEQSLECLYAHRLGDRRTPIAALGDVSGVSQAVHQDGPSACDADGTHPVTISGSAS
jgi:hypothetical protein